MKRQRPPAIVTPSNSQCLTVPLAEVSPHSARRRKRAAVASKTPEELILEAHDKLMDYIGHIDEQVRKVVAGHEADFLTAYRQHYGNVRQEMKEIRHRSANSLGDNSAFVDRIQLLEREVILFREESLQMSEVKNQQHQEILTLRFQIKQLVDDNSTLSKNWSRAVKDSKDANVALEGLKAQLSLREVQSGQRNFFSSRPSQQRRTLTTSVRLKHRPVHLGSESMERSPQFEPILEPESNRKQQIVKEMSRTVELRAEMPSHSDHSDHFEHYSDRKRYLKLNPREKFDKTRINAQKLVREEVIRLQSQEHVKVNEYRKVFIDCVEEVRKEILRKSGAPGLNFFKHNGPKSLLEFRHLDYHSLLYLFLRDEKVSQVVFSLLFAQEGK